MNKVTILMIVLISSVLFFTTGYKIGDSRGYEDGFNIGYQYDCRDELERLHDRVSNQSSLLFFTDSVVKSVLRQNDSLKNWFVAESLHRAFVRDSLKNWKLAKKKNVEIRKKTGTSLLNVYGEDGRFNPLSCLVDARLRSLRECREYRYLWE